MYPWQESAQKQPGELFQPCCEGLHFARWSVEVAWTLLRVRAGSLHYLGWKVQAAKLLVCQADSIRVHVFIARGRHRHLQP